MLLTGLWVSCFPSKVQTQCLKVCKRLTGKFCFGLRLYISELHADKNDQTSQGNFWWKITGTEQKHAQSTEEPQSHPAHLKPEQANLSPPATWNSVQIPLKSEIFKCHYKTNISAFESPWKIAMFGVLNEAKLGKVTKLHLKNLLIFPASMLLYMPDDKTESSLKCTCQSCQQRSCCLVMLRGDSSMFSLRGGGVIWIWQNKTLWLTQLTQTSQFGVRLAGWLRLQALRLSCAPRSHPGADPLQRNNEVIIGAAGQGFVSQRLLSTRLQQSPSSLYYGGRKPILELIWHGKYRNIYREMGEHVMPLDMYTEAKAI